MKVLIVDDSGTMRTIQRRCLEKLGVTEIAEAPNGRDGLEIFKCADFDMLMTDWNMPEMNGLELLEQVRSFDTTTPVIMITTEAERARVVTAIAAGVSDYLVKPFTPDQLREKLERWVGAPA